jgi:MarR family transcriptional regulator, 2-MHQ and catechol-resistance regulon repressor
MGDDGGVGAPRSWGKEEEGALRLWIALARSYLTFSRVVSAKVLEYGLTIPQFGILEALHHLGPLSLGELAEKLLVTGGNITYVMDRLEEQELVYRERSEEDRRVVKAHLTPAGEELIAQVFPGHAAFVQELVDHLSPHERDQLRELLKKLGKGIAFRAGEPGPDEGDLSQGA